MHDVGLALIIATALFFDFTNGFHDSANAIASSISTRALTPRIALAVAAVFNLVGALVSTKVARTVGNGIIEPELNGQGLLVIAAAVIGAITWNLITWWFGLPSSSTHALIGGLVGAGLAASAHVYWTVIWEKVVVPMIVSPAVGFVGGGMVMVSLLWLLRRAKPRQVNRSFKRLQPLAAAYISFAHGTQDAQKTMGVITLALVANGNLSEFRVPLWVKFAAAIAIAAGTFTGGRRIIRTLGRRVIKMDPPRGFATDVTAATVLYFATLLKAPVSTTHVITSTVMGVGATRRVRAVRWGVARSIVVAWILTLPAAGLMAALVWWVAHLFTG